MEQNKKSVVSISRAPAMDYSHNYVSLPKDYGSSKYYQRKDVQAILNVVRENLSALNEKIHFLESIQGKTVIIKPNLVAVFHKYGFTEDDYPESTDPRVIDALTSFIKPYAKKIVLAESSGRGMTRQGFKVSGLSKVAKFHNASIAILEECPVKRYILPQASVMKEILIPDIFEDVVNGNSFYISVPKMKTNLYTGVTLGFKNAMGLIPPNLRLRNHNYLINEKLVDILYLIKPDLVLIDGIVGGEGNTPAPLDPVDSRVIISGNNSVETDRVATRIMGFDPNQIKLINIAIERGFGDPNVEILGKEPRIPFKPAIRNIFDGTIQQNFPNTRILIGNGEKFGIHIDNIQDISYEQLNNIAVACDGGCIPNIITMFEFIRYYGLERTFNLTVLIGSGIETEDGLYFVDYQKKAFSIDNIKNLPGVKVALGTCTKNFSQLVDLHFDGCMPYPAGPVFEVMKALHLPVYFMNPLKNKQLFKLLFSMLKTTRIRKSLLKKGIWLDCPLSYEDKIFETRPLTETELKQSFIEWPLPPMTTQQKQAFLKQEKLGL